ncbi:MAG: hypothetical protein AAF436_17615 [Myxococcota bacterium]
MPPKLPNRTKQDLYRACKKSGEKVQKMVPGRSNRAKTAKYFNQQLCKDVDQKVLKIVFKQLAKQADKRGAKAPKTVPKIKAVPKMVAPKGVPSVKIPVPWSIPLGEHPDGKKREGKFEVNIWGDPRTFEETKKGAFLNFTVRFHGP